MSDRRRDPLTGAEVIVVAHRQERPNLPAGGCPFCPGGIEAPDDYDVLSFPNRWPSLSDGRAEVVLYTPDHHAAFASLGHAGARRVVDLWAERTTSLGARPDVEYVLVFENRGAEVGATIAHPHGQIYAFDFVPPEPAAELAADSCTLCDTDPGDHLVADGHGWRAWVPDAATWPYGMVLAAREHVADLPSLDGRGRDGLAAMLLDILGRLDRLFDEPMPYMLWMHQRPTGRGEWPSAHLHVHLAPYLRAPQTPRFVAAGELGSGVYFNPVRPEDAAAALKELRE